jgi:hypothetical protein
MANLGLRKPFNKSTGRDYKDEYARYQGTEEQKKKRAVRNAARRTMAAAGKVSKGDGKEVDHRRTLKNGGSNLKSNLRVVDKKRNRAFPRDSKNRPIGEC